MYKQILFILAAAMMLSGCETKKEAKSDLQKMNLEGRISKVVIATSSARFAKGSVRLAKTTTDKNHYNYIMEFNEDGNIVNSRTINHRMKTVNEVNYEYDGNKRLISETHLNGEGIEKKKLYEYSGDNLIYIRTEDGHASEIGRQVFEYDGDKIIKKEEYKNGVLVSSDTLLSKKDGYEAWEHSDENGIVNHEFIYENGFLKEAICGDVSHLFERDEKGNITKAYNASASPEGYDVLESKSKDGVQSYKYKFDKRGNWKSKTEYYGEEGVVRFVVSRKIFYEDKDEE